MGKAAFFAMHAYTLSKLCPTLKKNTCKLAARATSERIGLKVFNNALKMDFENLLDLLERHWVLGMPPHTLKQVWEGDSD